MEFIPLGFMFFLGAVIASFATVVAERLHTGMSWMSGRSRCNSCGKYLRASDLVPIISWLLSGGRCRACGSKVPVSYLYFEALVGFVFALGYWFIGPTLALPAFCAAVAVLAFIVLYDLRHTIVPRVASSALIVCAIMFALLSTGVDYMFGVSLVVASIIGLAFLALHVFTRGKAMGIADAPVAFALALLAAPYAFTGLLFSFWIGAVWGIGVLVTRRGGPRMGIEVPFVPFLALGFLIAYFLQWNPLAF